MKVIKRDGRAVDYDTDLKHFFISKNFVSIKNA